MELSKRKGVSAAALKWIAVSSMLIDHSAYVFFLTWLWPTRTAAGLVPVILPAARTAYRVLRGIGRLSFPLFCFLLTEGYRHTRSVKRYLRRLLCFGLLSEIPYDLAFYRTWLHWGDQNVYFTLFLGLLAVWAADSLTRNAGPQPLSRRMLRGALAAGAVIGCMAAAHLARTDYGWVGVLLIVILFRFRANEAARDVLSCLALLLTGQAPGALWRSILGGSFAVAYGGKSEIVGFPVFALLHFYNGQRGRQPKYFFYLFYPLHLALLALVRFLAAGW